MDTLAEQTSALSRAGSFYYKNLPEENRTVAAKLTRFPGTVRVFNQFRSCADATLSGGYFPDSWKVIRFTDKDIEDYGADPAIQRRIVIREDGISYIGKEAGYKIDNVAAIEVQENKLVGQLKREDNLDELLLFPGDGTLEFPIGFKPVFGIYIDPDIYVTSIRRRDGSLMLLNRDFISYYGLVIFSTNPVILFPNMKFLAASYVRRSRNLLSYTLKLDNVYGPVDRILNYYRSSQSVRSFYLAAAQACGLRVVRKECRVLYRNPLHKGCSYITTDGRYDAPYEHISKPIGTVLKEGEIIGGPELFVMHGPEQSLPPVTEISLDYVLPVKGLVARDKEIQVRQGGQFWPAFEGSEASLSVYRKFLAKIAGHEPAAGSSVETANAIRYVTEEMFPGKYILIQVNEGKMNRRMYLSLMTFIRREMPVGSVLLYSNLENTFTYEP